MSDRAEIHQENFQKLFYPKSIVIVGANKVMGTVPYDILKNILDGHYTGTMYPVNPRHPEIAEIRTYKYVIDIEDPVDLAIVVYPSSVCHMALEQCGQKGIKAVIIISAGFKEVGGAGIEREQQIVEIARKYDISIIGPNCLGVINTDPTVSLNASFARRMPNEGSIGFLSQSGALCTAVLDYAQAKNIGFSKFISFGNKSDVSEIDLLYYLAKDERTKVILLYLEEVSNGPALMKACMDVISQYEKPVLIIKSGRTSAGASAAASHTGSLAGSDEICDAAFRQAGIIRCDNIEEMFNTAIAFAYQPIPKSNKIAIITNAGGPGVLATDASIKTGLQLASFSEETTAVLKKNLPATANIKNPVDVIGDARADRYNVAITSAINDPDVDGIFVILTPQSMTDIDTIAQEVADLASESTKPVYTSFMGELDVKSGIQILQNNKIPHYTLPEYMSSAFSNVHNFSKITNRQFEDAVAFNDVNKAEAHKILNSAKEAGKSYLYEAEAVKVLEAYNLPVVANGIAKTEEESVQLAEKVGYPVVMKVMSDTIVHKVDVKGVELNINSEEETRKAYQSIHENVKSLAPEAVISGILVSKQVQKGEEVILGVKRDPSFGAVIMFGLGGTFVEIFKDVSFRVTPVDVNSVHSMIREIKAYKILAGARGRNPKDTEAITEAIQRLSQLAVDCPQIQELDINPLIVLDENQGCFIADAKIMI